jgi:hypothetical protein
VTFQLVGEPYIAFEKEYGDNINILQGDNGRYESPFALKDFLTAPKVAVKSSDESFRSGLKPNKSRICAINLFYTTAA